MKVIIVNLEQANEFLPKYIFIKIFALIIFIFKIINGGL